MSGTLRCRNLNSMLLPLIRCLDWLNQRSSIALLLALKRFAIELPGPRLLSPIEQQHQRSKGD